MITGENILLRALEPEDLPFLANIENDTGLWQVGELHQPISQFTLKAYLAHAHETLAEAGQMRLAICLEERLIGLADLFDYDARNQRAGAGIVIDRQFQNHGFAKEALQLIIRYAKDYLLLHQLHCQIQSSNTASIQAFETVGFHQVGILKDWLRTATGFEDVLQYQRLL